MRVVRDLADRDRQGRPHQHYYNAGVGRHQRRIGLLVVVLTAWWSTACESAPREVALPTASPTAPPAAATATLPPQLPTNPLSGLEVTNPSLLKIPVVLISISHFPATARPQAGLSFAPFVYEFYITEGATRFLAAFHGEWPAAEIPMSGNCEPRIGPFDRLATLLGNRVWFDADTDGVQDPGEGGITGMCVDLYDESDQLMAQTTTDTNGFYGFNVPPGRYTVEFVRPQQLAFVARDAGQDSRDSDPDPGTGRVQVQVGADELSVDAGLTSSAGPSSVSGPAPELPLAQVGPIRSGRLIYRYLADSFQDSCLIFAGASPEVLERLPQCAVVFHQISGGGYMMDLSEFWSIAKANKRRSGSELDYSGYQFSNAPVPDGVPATALQVYFSYQNQSGWYYDPLSESYLRYVDTSERQQAGILHPETDRLTGRQLHFENLIVLFARHQVVSPTNLDIHLDPGRTGKAILFRDGLALNIDWSNVRDEESEGGRPIRFLQKNGEPALLRPGHTWVIVVTPETTVEKISGSSWQLIFAAPPGAK